MLCQTLAHANPHTWPCSSRGFATFFKEKMPYDSVVQILSYEMSLTLHLNAFCFVVPILYPVAFVCAYLLLCMLYSLSAKHAIKFGGKKKDIRETDWYKNFLFGN